MKKTLTSKDIGEMLDNFGNLEEQELMARRRGEKRLKKEEMLQEEIKDLKFHVSRFAAEGATARQIKEYKILLKYVDILYEMGAYYECAKLSTTLKIFFGMDITFFTLLPHLAEEAFEKGPITYRKILEKARFYEMAYKETYGNKIDLETINNKVKGKETNQNDPKTKKPRNTH